MGSIKTFVHPVCQGPEQKGLELTMIGSSHSLIKKYREAACLGNHGSKMGNVVVQINCMTRNEHCLCNHDKGALPATMVPLVRYLGNPLQTKEEVQG